MFFAAMLSTSANPAPFLPLGKKVNSGIVCPFLSLIKLLEILKWTSFLHPQNPALAEAGRKPNNCQRAAPSFPQNEHSHLPLFLVFPLTIFSLYPAHGFPPQSEEKMMNIQEVFGTLGEFLMPLCPK